MYRYIGETWVQKVQSHQREPTTAADTIGWHTKNDVMGWRKGSVTPRQGSSRESSPAHGGTYNVAGHPSGRLSMYKTEYAAQNPTPARASPHSRKDLGTSLYGSEKLQVQDIMQWKDAKTFRRMEATPLHAQPAEPEIRPTHFMAPPPVSSQDGPGLQRSATSFKEGLKLPQISAKSSASLEQLNALRVNGRQSSFAQGDVTPRERSRHDQFRMRGSAQGHVSPGRLRTPSSTGRGSNEKFFNFEYITPWKLHNEKKKVKPWTKLPWSKFTLYGQ